MAKAGVPKKAKPKPKLTDKEQSERFIKTARMLGADESGAAFHKAFKKIVPSKLVRESSKSSKHRIVDD